MKNIEDLFFTVTKILSTAWNFEQLHFFFQLLENELLYTYGILLSFEQLMLFVSSRWHFWKKCRAVEIWAVEIRAVAFRAVDPDSFRKDYKLLNMVNMNFKGNNFTRFLFEKKLCLKLLIQHLLLTGIVVNGIKLSQTYQSHITLLFLMYVSRIVISLLIGSV